MSLNIDLPLVGVQVSYFASFRCLSKVGVDIKETHPGFTLDNFRKELADSLVGGFLQVE